MATRFPQVGDTFGPYAITGQVGQGHAGVVFRAVRAGAEGEVALKVIRPRQTAQPGFRAKFLADSAVIAALDTPHVVTVQDVGEQNGCLYVASELVGGGDLGRRLDTGGALPIDLADALTGQVATALGAAHAAGVVHGNLKPSNVLLGERDGHPHVQVTDFGVVPAATVVGANSYLAPERLGGAEATVASDIYSLGCLLVAAVTGLAPYQGTDAEVAEQHRRRAVPAWEETGPVQARLNQLVRRSMAKDPAHRYPSTDAFLAELGAAAAAEPVVPTPPAVEPEPVEPEPVEPDPAEPDPAEPEPAEPEPAEEPAHPTGPKALLVSVVALALVAGVVTGLVILEKRSGQDDDESQAQNQAQAQISATPSASPAAIDRARTCQEGTRQVAAGERCGEPYGLPGLRFVFPGITSACTGLRLNSDKYWQYECSAGTATVVYSTFKTNPLASQHNEDAYASAPTTLPSGLLRYGPEKRADGTFQVALMYNGTHPYGVEVTAASADRATQIASGLAVRAPTAFRGD